jgi:hypothetical protein
MAVIIYADGLLGNGCSEMKTAHHGGLFGLKSKHQA